MVEADTPYFESVSGETLRLDVYRPESGSGYALVVLFHANPVFGTTKEDVQALATSIAERGNVVVAPTWGRAMSLNDMAAIAAETASWYREQGPCAVWAAAGLAQGVGADGGHLILVGETTGVLPAQVVTFDPPASADGCLFPPIEVPIERALLFEADWLLVPSIWDQVLADDPDYMFTSAYWDQIANPASTEILMLVGERSAPNTVRSLEGDTYLQSEWIGLRDPDGLLADAFAASGTLDDGEMSFTDVTQVVTAALVAGGWDAQLIAVPGAGHALDTREAREFVADLVGG